MKINLTLAAILLTLSGCVTGYQKHTWSGGYKDKALGNGKHFVEYYGNGSTHPDLVLQRWHMRSKELCPEGYEVLNNNAGENTGTTSAPVGGAYIPLSVSHPFVKGEIECKAVN